MKEITLEITHYCPHGCPYCSSRAHDDRSKAVHLTLSDVENMLQDKRYDRINISGGEPLSHPQFYDILMSCRDHADDVIVYTNAITHLRYNANVIDGVYLEANLTVLPEVDQVHVLRRVKQGREASRPQVHVSRNFRENCACDHRVMIPTGEWVMTPCNKYTKLGDKSELPAQKIYVVGSHGVGKTTLIKNAVKAMDVKWYENPTKNPHRTDVMRRQLWRLYKYKTDEEILRTFSGKVLVNRCVMDWVIYTSAFKKLGWLSTNDFNYLMDKYGSLFGNDMPDTIVFLNPPRKWSMERIKERWDDNKKKWREDDFDYYEVLRDVYDDIIQQVGKVTRVVEVNDVRHSTRLDAVREVLARV